MNDFESDELVVGTRAAYDEEEGGVAAVHDLGVPVFEEVAHARAPGEDELGDVFYDFGFVFWGEGCEPFCEALSRYQYAELVGMLRVLHTTLPCLESRIR